MGKKRLIYIGGWIDYSVATFEDILTDLKEIYLYHTIETMNKLELLKKDVLTNSERLDDPEEIAGWIEDFILIFRGFKYDLIRVIEEIPQGIDERHIDIISDIAERSYREEKDSYRGFKNEHICRTLKDESLRPLIDEIAGTYGDQLACNKNLGSLRNRLRTFVGSDLGKKIKREQKEYQQLSKTINIAPVRPFPTPEGATWRHVNLVFFSDTVVEIAVKEIKEIRDYAEMDFANRITGEPNILWSHLQAFANKKHEIVADFLTSEKKKNNLRKNVGRMSNQLKKLFGINELPYECYKTSCYRAKFNISLGKNATFKTAGMVHKLYTKDGFMDENIKETYDFDIKKRINSHREGIDFAIVEEVEGPKKKD